MTAVAYGDPHLITFDGKDYTFNGKGEFTLLNSKRFNFKLQARFEQPPNATCKFKNLIFSKYFNHLIN